MTHRRRRFEGRKGHACGACGRMITEEQIASHERVCPAWRRRAHETHEEAPESPLEPAQGAPGATGGPPA